MKFKGGCDLRILCDSNHKINKNIAGAQAHNSISFFVKLKDVGEKKSFKAKQWAKNRTPKYDKNYQQFRGG